MERLRAARVTTFLLLAASLLRGVVLAAQGNATASVSGHVTSSDGVALPDVTVTAESPALQGKRTVMTSAAGDYLVTLLPAGEYTIAFTRTGFQTAAEQVRVPIGASVALSLSMSVESVTQLVTVDARAPGNFGEASAAVSSYTADLVERLPLDRSLNGTILLAPGVKSTGPGGAMSISGAVSYESLFLINGVVADDNQTGQPYPLFIEDAIQEISVSTGSISAEYGRFSGGVVNAITKSGGNRFGGSIRATATDDAWTALTPFPNDSRVHDVLPTYEATLGGPLINDKVWFFAAGRHSDPQNAATTSFTNIPYVFENDENRYEGKLTYTLGSRHTFKASQTQIDLAQHNRSSGTFLDLASLSDRTNPQSLVSASYSGIMTPTFFLETQFSRRTFSLDGSGAKTTDLIGGTLLLDRQENNAKYHAPSSCGVCTSERRDNDDAMGKASYFLSTKGTGSHDLVAGGDVFNDTRFDNEHPSASDYSIYGTTTIFRNGTLYPEFNNDGTTFIRWSPVLLPTQGTHFRTYSLFANDGWRVNDRISVNLGVRFDKHGGTDSIGNAVLRDSAVSPRLAIAWSPRGDAAWTLSAGLAKYVAGMLVTVADSSSPGGRAATFDYLYQGPAINTVPSAASLASQNDAIQTVFNWFNANGGTNRTTRGSPTVPGLTTIIQNGLGSPNVVEATLGIVRRWGATGAVRVDGQYRSYGSFYSDRVDLGSGRVTNSIGQTFDLDVVNNSSGVERRYAGVVLQASDRVGRLDLGGQYMLSKTYGNFDGEAFPGGGGTNATDQRYPEYTQASWNRPMGALSIDQRHRARWWATYRLPTVSAVGAISVSALEALESGTPYGAVGLVDPRPYLSNPGYVNPPATESYYFTSRDAFRTDVTTRTDAALNVARHVGFGLGEFFFRATIVNMFNQQGIANAGAVDQSVLTSNNSAKLQGFNPFQTAPVRGVNWDVGPNFGRPLTRLAYQTPRTFSFSAGFRF